VQKFKKCSSAKGLMNTKGIIQVWKEYYKTVLNRIGRGYPRYNTQRGANDVDGEGTEKIRKKERMLD
jgi:hypothetical protein